LLSDPGFVFLLGASSVLADAKFPSPVLDRPHSCAIESLCLKVLCNLLIKHLAGMFADELVGRMRELLEFMRTLVAQPKVSETPESAFVHLAIGPNRVAIRPEIATLRDGAVGLVGRVHWV
jgi:hypothetical protein